MAPKALSAGGRRAAIETIDAIMGDSKNLAHFRERLQEAFEEDPIRFWQEIASPLIPKTHLIGNEADRGISINIVMRREPKTVQAQTRDGETVELIEGLNPPSVEDTIGG